MYKWIRLQYALLFTFGFLCVGGLYRLLKGYSSKKKKLQWKNHIFICSVARDWMENEKLFMESMYKAKVIGLDCEWVTENSKRLPVSLLQIATASDTCVLIRISYMARTKPFPSGMIKLLEDESILKVGVGIWEDVKKLHEDYGIIVKGFCDLRYLVDIAPHLSNIKNKSLKELAKSIIGVEIDKPYHVRCSNWEGEILTENQILYAAGDAVYAAQIFDALMQKISFSGLWGLFSSTENIGNSLISKFVSIPYCGTSSLPHKNTSLFKCTHVKDKGKHYTGVRQRPFYDNCILIAPDGEILCVCNYQKIQWYLEKDLGELISEDPITLQLKFEPAARPILDKEYYIYGKDNCCVVCGADVSLIKKCVVPTEYKRFFPEILKSHLSHDVLLLCVPCHRVSNVRDLFLRQELAKECNAPIGNADNVKKKENPELSRVRSASRALLQTKNKVPANRKEELENTVKVFFRTQQITQEILKMGSNIETCLANEHYISHGERVVQQMCRNGELLEFEKRWRQHFLDSMKPMFLPKMWSVTHSHEWLAFQVLEGNVDFDPSILGLSEELLQTAAMQKQIMNDAKNLPETEN